MRMTLNRYCPLAMALHMRFQWRAKHRRQKLNRLAKSAHKLKWINSIPRKNQTLFNSSTKTVFWRQCSFIHNTSQKTTEGKKRNANIWLAIKFNFMSVFIGKEKPNLLLAPHNIVATGSKKEEAFRVHYMLESTMLLFPRGSRDHKKKFKWNIKIINWLSKICDYYRNF